MNANERRRSNASAINATLDRGSDDIDYYRLSSPETTDNSASSLESQQLLGFDRMRIDAGKQIAGNTPTSAAPASWTGESGSDDEYCSRSRSKSLTGSEVRFTYIPGIHIQ